MQSIEKSAAAIITRPPEIIACFKVADPSMPGNSAFVVFDSHPRPSHPHGAGLIFSSSLENTIKILRGILHVDKNLLSSPDLQWEAQLLTNCSGHIFLGRDGKFDVDRSMVESSLTVLALRSEIKELTKQNDDLAVQNRYLEKEARVLEGAIQQERLNAARGASYAAAVLHRQEQKPSWRHYSQPNAVAGPSRIPSNNRAPGYHGARSIFADNPPPVPARKPSPYPFEDVLEKVQIDLLEEDRRAGQAVQNLNIAFQLQQKFDAEDAALRQQQAALSCLVQRTFKCQICLEELPEDDAARVDACGHMLCRACMREFISAKIAEHRFPILCPICVANGGSAGEISGLLVEQIGITESEYGIWIGMELSQFSILLHCRKYVIPLKMKTKITDQ
ncbi:hypothetical protein ID866_7285 [Astraeus odoratus]|nr:hypothetical protein ID866_7285 [Astraeus odoratus]